MADFLTPGLALSASEIKDLTRWPDAMVEDYLNIIRELVEFASSIETLQVNTTEDTQKIEEIRIFIDNANARLNSFMMASADARQLQEKNALEIDRNQALWAEAKRFAMDTRQLAAQLGDEIANLRARVSREESQSGWAQYADTTYTSGSPFVLSSGRNALPNDAGSSITRYLPRNTNGFYDGTAITPSRVGDLYNFALRFNASYSGTAPVIDISVDIGGGGPANDIFTETINFKKGSGATNSYAKTYVFYSLDTFVANGGIVTFNKISGGTTNIFDIQYVINRSHAANQ